MNDKYLPARIDAIAAIRKLRITDGPAVSWATWPVRMYVPVPNVDPIPKIIINNLQLFIKENKS
jgi:hypothetical protein